MIHQEPAEPNEDIYPRDQLEHYKIELTRLRAENERLANEVGYLRQALAASLSKIPQLTAPAEASLETSVAATDDPEREAPFTWRTPWDNKNPSMRTTFGFISLASMIASPVVFLALLGLILLCSLIFGGYYVAFGS
ncbi:MAG: hypothetical protein KDF65_08795 [Anaerolineae bacterium]|nr:hypothetical protein [Anaerolineae bacterium]